MSDDVMWELLRRARTDEDFRRDALADLEGTLAKHGYDLTEDELAAARQFHSRAAAMSEEQLVDALTAGVTPHAG